MANRNKWATEAILTAWLLVPTSAFDLLAKLVMYITTLYCLQRATLDLCDACRLEPSKHTPKASRRRLLTVNALVCGAWGVVLSGFIIQAVGFRIACPSYCFTHSYPMLDLSCHCIYTHVNCAQLGIGNPIPLLSTDKIGTSLFYLEMSRCPFLRDGLAKETLAPFEQLNQIALLFSDMETWNGPLPSTINGVDIRYSNLRSIPNVFLQEIPDALATIQIEVCPLGQIPESVCGSNAQTHSLEFDHWSHIDKLELINVSLTSVPSGLLSM
ncbi:unnamed protein product [Aphanomyces euteiches]